jgi:hypothetical protein
MDIYDMITNVTFILIVIIAIQLVLYWAALWILDRFHIRGPERKVLLATMAALFTATVVGIISADRWFMSPQNTAWQRIVDYFGFPEIPLLPPSSASTSLGFSRLEEYCDYSGISCNSLLTLSAETVLAISDAGFPEVAVFFGYDGHFDVAPKVIIITPVERVSPEGVPAVLDRFDDTAPQAIREYGWREFLRLIFNGRDGHLRFFVIEINDGEYIPFNANPPSYIELTERVETGAVPLPAVLKEIPVGPFTHITLHVYTYNAFRGQEPKLVEGERLPQAELALAGILLPIFSPE